MLRSTVDLNYNLQAFVYLLYAEWQRRKHVQSSFLSWQEFFVGHVPFRNCNFKPKWPSVLRSASFCSQNLLHDPGPCGMGHACPPTAPWIHLMTAPTEKGPAFGSGCDAGYKILPQMSVAVSVESTLSLLWSKEITIMHPNEMLNQCQQR